MPAGLHKKKHQPKVAPHSMLQQPVQPCRLWCPLLQISAGFFTSDTANIILAKPQRPTVKVVHGWSALDPRANACGEVQTRDELTPT